MNFTVEQADYHRNGVCGQGFYVGVAACEFDGERHRMLITFFPEHDEEGVTMPAGKDGAGEFANGRVAVLSLNRLGEYGVQFGPNSWRGDDFYEVADAIVQTVQERWSG